MELKFQRKTISTFIDLRHVPFESELGQFIRALPIPLLLFHFVSASLFSLVAPHLRYFLDDLSVKKIAVKQLK